MVDQYEKVAEIGNGTSLVRLLFLYIGSFGKVCKIMRKSDGKVLVWKELNYAKMSDKEKQ